MDLMKKYGGKLFTVIILFAAIYFAWQYFGLRGQIPETNISKNRMKSGLVDDYHRDVLPLEQQLHQAGTPEERRKIIAAWNSRTGEHREEENLLNGESGSLTPPPATVPAPAANLPGFINNLEQTSQTQDLGNIQLDPRLGEEPIKNEFEGPGILRVTAVSQSIVYTLGKVSNPGGLGPVPSDAPGDTPSKKLDYYVLYGRWDDGTPFPIGMSKEVSIPEGKHTLILGSNVPKSLILATLQKGRPVAGYGCKIVEGKN
jgi:hypothetical protein